MNLAVHIGLAASIAMTSPESRVVVAPAAVQGAVGDENLERLRESVHSALAGNIQEATGDACDDAGCAAALAADAGASQVVTWRIAVDGRDFQTSVTLRDGATGEPVATSERTCEICGIREVANVLAEQAAAVSRRASATAPARVRVTTRPDGAEVRIDGELVGVTPYEGELPEGAHELEVGKGGYIERSRRLEAVGGVVEQLHLELQPVPDEGPRVSPMAISGAVALVLGVGATVTGATFIGLHHQPVKSRCTGDDIDDAGICRLRFNGLPSGIPLLVGGLVGVATGVALLVVDGKRRRRERARVTPTATGIAIAF